MFRRNAESVEVCLGSDYFSSSQLFRDPYMYGNSKGNSVCSITDFLVLFSQAAGQHLYLEDLSNKHEPLSLLFLADFCCYV